MSRSSASPHTPTFRAASGVGFLLLGAAISLYGPAVPVFVDRFGVSTSVAGLVLPVHAATSVAGVLAWGVVDARGWHRHGLLAGAGAVVTGAVGVAVAGGFAAVVAGVVLIGLGFGLLDTGTNALFARDRTEGAIARMNRLHAMFGIGAVGFPLLLSVTSVRTSFLTVAAIMLVALPALRHATDPGTEPADDDSPAARRSARWLLAGFLVVFALYVGTEMGVANWMASHLTDQGWSAAAGARWTSAYFLAFTTGRLLVARFASQVPPARVVITALSLGGVAALAASVSGVTPYAYVFVGLVISPVFPTTMIWLSLRLPELRHGPAGAMLTGSIGAAVFPALTGAAVAAGGTEVVPYTVAGIAVLAVLAAVSVRRSARRHDPRLVAAT